MGCLANNDMGELQCCDWGRPGHAGERAEMSTRELQIVNFIWGSIYIYIYIYIYIPSIRIALCHFHELYNYPNLLLAKQAYQQDHRPTISNENFKQPSEHCLSVCPLHVP
jgi:hypothetical protein